MLVGDGGSSICRHVDSMHNRYCVEPTVGGLV